jgi:hypothetical protein
MQLDLGREAATLEFRRTDGGTSGVAQVETAVKPSMAELYAYPGRGLGPGRLSPGRAQPVVRARAQPLSQQPM